MTPDEIRQARLRLGLSRSQFAERLGVKLRTVEEWEWKGRRSDPPPYLYRALRDLERELTATPT